MSTNYLIDAAKAILEQRDQLVAAAVTEPIVVEAVAEVEVADEKKKKKADGEADVDKEKDKEAAVVAEKVVVEKVVVEDDKEAEADMAMTDVADEKKKKKADGDADKDKDKDEVVAEAAEPAVVEVVAPVSLKSDVEAFLASESNLSEEFKVKVTTIYEARIADKTAQITEAMEVKHRALLDEAVASITKTLTEQTDAFLNDVTTKWMEENALAVDTGLRAELTEDFIQGMKNLFSEHYIDLPAEKLDVVTEMSTKIESLEESLKSLTEQHLVMTQQLKDSQKVQIIGTVCEGLTQTQTEKVRSLVESAEFTTDGEYRTKVETIRENYFPSTVKKAESETLSQVIESESTLENTNSVMAAYTKSITQLNK